MPGDAERQREMPEHVPADEHGDEGSGDGEVGLDDAAGPPGQRDDGGQRAQIVAGQDRDGAVQGEVGSLPAHGDAQIGGGRRSDGRQGRRPPA
ncbi:hypothetical protein [Actinoplanes sandaracinus]|uniref:hypothetical protein n=1 Tax=Actinoplanes sandaracinus TaxID=3045177 RepID=UPI002E1AA9D5